MNEVNYQATFPLVLHLADIKRDLPLYRCTVCGHYWGSVIGQNPSRHFTFECSSLHP